MFYDDSIPGLIVALTGTGLGVHAQVPIRKGQRLYRIQGCLCPAPTRFSLQVAATVHVEPGGADWGHINHSCDPNLVVDFANWRFRAARDIAEGEQLGLNYLNTERELATPFACRCGARTCFGFIGGYAGLDAARRRRLGADLAEHLRDDLGRVFAYGPPMLGSTLTPASFGIEG